MKQVLPAAEQLSIHWTICCDPECPVIQTLQARLIAEADAEINAEER